MFAQEFVGIGSARKCQHPNVKLPFEQQANRALRGRLSRGIWIVIHYHSPRGPRQKLDLRFRETGPAACHHIRETRARHGDRVHVAFHENCEIVFPQRFLGAVQMIEHTALRVDGRFRRVHILRHIFTHCAPAKCDHLATLVRDGKHDAPSKTVVEPAALVPREKPRYLEQLFRVFGFQPPQQRVPRRGRPSQTESFYRFAIQPAILKIRRRYLSFRSVVQLPCEKCRSLAVRFHQRAALLIFHALFRRTLARLRNRYPTFFRHGSHRFRECTLVHLHHELENVAARTAAEAMVDLPHRMHRE